MTAPLSVLRRLWSWCPLGWVRHIPREIDPATGAPVRYLDRYSVRRQKQSGSNEWRIYLHAFHAPDSEGHHNHPCRFGWALVLRGSYTEEYLEWEDCRTPNMIWFGWTCNGHGDDSPCGVRPVVRRRRVRWFNWVPASKYHRITQLHPRRPGGAVWTLFFMGPLKRDPATGARAGWGFWVPGRGHVPHEVREAERVAEARQPRGECDLCGRDGILQMEHIPDTPPEEGGTGFVCSVCAAKLHEAERVAAATTRTFWADTLRLCSAR